MFNATEACMRNCSKVGVSWLIMKVTLSSWKQESGTLFFNIHTKFYQNNGRGLPICRSLACKSSRCPRNQIETASKPQQAKKQVLNARYKKKERKTEQTSRINVFVLDSGSTKLFTWNLSVLRKRRPCRLPSGMRTTTVTAPSMSGGGSDGNDACLDARLDSSSYFHKTWGTTWQTVNQISS